MVYYVPTYIYYLVIVDHKLFFHVNYVGKLSSIVFSIFH